MRDLPLTMRAWRLRAPAPVAMQPLELVELPLPEWEADELLVRVAACAVCRTDLHVVEGELPVRRPQVIPGHQIVGTVVAMGREAGAVHHVGDRVGVAWLHRACGSCRFCSAGRENLCEAAEFTGWTVDGGFAEYVRVPAPFAYPIPARLEPAESAPLLCAGIIGWRSLRATGLLERVPVADRALERPPFRLGLYGFGAAGHLALQMARARGAEVFVCTRDRTRHQALARELGATWVGAALERPPVALDAAILFAPAGELVPAALQALDQGGRLVLGGIHMSPIPALPYALLHGERRIESVANNTRADGREFLAAAAQAGVRTSVELFPFEQADRALVALAQDAVRGSAVLLFDRQDFPGADPLPSRRPA